MPGRDVVKADRKTSGAAGGKAPRLFAGGIDMRQDFPNFIGIGSAGNCQPDAAGQSFEKLDANFLFQLPDLPRQRGLSDAEHLGSAPEMFRPRDRGEIS